MEEAPQVKIVNCPNPVIIQAHANFNLKRNPALAVMLANIDGVEQVNEYSTEKYCLQIQIGLMFDREKLGLKIKDSILEFVKEEQTT